MSRRALVSILTPSFNQATWLEKNIASVAAQTYAPVEHIVMDGGSTDGTRAILKRSDTLWRSESDRGQSHALNKAFARSRGDIIGWINSDDAYFNKRSVEWAVDAFERHPEADVVYGHAAIVNAHDELLHLKWVPRFSRRLILIHNFLIQPAVFVRRSAVEGDALVDETLHFTMDRALWLRLSERHAKFVRIDHVLAVDRRQPERKSAALGELWDERRQLDERYGAPLGAWTGAVRTIAHAAARMNGARLLKHAFDSGNLIAAPSRRSLLRRQLAQRQRNMPA